MKFLINEIAKIIGVTTNTIRRYENNGLIKSERDPSNYRWYKSYDISKLAMIRLYRKCGFTHDEIKAMTEDRSRVKDICANKLETMDKQLERIARLRHWLKDNIQLMNTAELLKDNYVIMKCPALYYVLYSVDDMILKEKKRLDTINCFMYEAPEVQLINILKRDEERGRYISCSGWAIKEIDIKKFNLGDIIENNEYIGYYPSISCLYCTAEISERDMYSGKGNDILCSEVIERAYDYLGKNNYRVNGDIMEIVVNSFGEKVSALICIPIAR